MYGSVCIALHEAVRRDWGARELFPPSVVLLLGMLPTLGNLWIVPTGEGARFWNGSFMDMKGFSPLSETSFLFPASAPEVCSFVGAAVGMKNLAPVILTGLADGIDGAWNRFVEAPPPLLKVSTYLLFRGRNKKSFTGEWDHNQ